MNPHDTNETEAPDTEQRAAGPEPKDFRRLHASGEPAGTSRAIGGSIAAARDQVARVLIHLGVRPNHVSVAGLLMTVAAGLCLAAGAGQQVPYAYTGAGPVGWWPTLALLFLFLSGACDMLDGAVARVGNLATSFGAVLDSTLDRLADIAIFGGCFVYFARHDNLTLQLVCGAALCNALLISYIKARAEAIIPDCSVGYWLRGERFAAVLIGCAVGHVPAVLWQLAILSALTVARRLQFTRRMLHALERQAPPPAAGPEPGWRGRLQPWRQPRGSIWYDVVTGTNIAYIIFAPWLFPILHATGPVADPLGRWLGN